MNGTLQDRLVKELRLRRISSQADANAFVAVFVADFNARFAKPPRSDFNAHRPVRADEDPERIFTWREWRKVSQSLTLQYDKTLYLLADQPAHRALIHRYLEVAEYPDGRIELWADGASLPYTTYDRLAEIDQGAIVENKRLGHVLRVAQEMQAKRDSRRSAGAPARTIAGTPPRPRKAAPRKKPQRQLSPADLQAAIEKAFKAPLPYGKPLKDKPPTPNTTPSESDISA
ncbi:hypothetical protein [Cupriavidus necator]